LGDTLEVAMIVGVLETDLNRVMINIADGKFGSNPRDIHGFKLQISHGSRGILGQGLIDPDTDLHAGPATSGREMRDDNFFSNRFPHMSLIP
jgi:hypothetical protein